jgi:hypothetical protein
MISNSLEQHRQISAGNLERVVLWTASPVPKIERISRPRLVSGNAQGFPCIYSSDAKSGFIQINA